MATKTASWLLSIEELQAMLRPNVGRLGRVVWPIWDYYQQLPESHRLIYDPTTEANMLHCYMVDAAKRGFANAPGIQFLETYGFHLGIDGTAYGVDGLVVCRFKKFDEDGKSRNYPTDRAEALRRNEQLDGMPEQATYVDVGYSFNLLRTALSDVSAVRVLDSKLILSIPRVEDQSTQMPGTLPFGPMPAERRFTLINRKAKKSEGTDGN